MPTSLPANSNQQRIFLIQNPGRGNAGAAPQSIPLATQQGLTGVQPQIYMIKQPGSTQNQVLNYFELKTLKIF